PCASSAPRWKIAFSTVWPSGHRSVYAAGFLAHLGAIGSATTEEGQRHPFRPVGKLVVRNLTSRSGVERTTFAEDLEPLARGDRALPQLLCEAIYVLGRILRVQHGPDVELVEIELDFLRVEYVAQLVHTKLFENPLELLLKDLPDPQLDRIFEREVECSYGMLLSDTVHPANALLEPHRIPREVVVYDYVAELQVQP